MYNGPAEPLKAQGAIDIPRGEFWINHSSFYKDGKDSIDILRVVKETAAAAHIYGKRLIEMEAFTSFMNWQEAPVDMKPYADRAFCEGMNRVVFHGFSHNPAGTGFPGNAYYAGTHFNPKRIWWSKTKPFVDYLTRISALFQGGLYQADVLWYYGDKVPNTATPKNTHFKVGPGYDYEVINTDILTDSLTFQDGKLRLPQGQEFSVLVLENEHNIHPKVLNKLEELIARGAIIIGEKPEKVNAVQPSAAEQQAIDRLWDNNLTPQSHHPMLKQRIYAGISPLRMLQDIGLKPDISYADESEGTIDFIHFDRGTTAVYFVRNTRQEWISREICFRQQDKSPEIWDPMSGKIIPVCIYRESDGGIHLPLTLAPYGAQFVVFDRQEAVPHFTSVSRDGVDPPMISYNERGFSILESGSIILTKQQNVIKRNINTVRIELNGPWSVSFTKGWGAPETTQTFLRLKSWTESKTQGIRYYSGLATYQHIFYFKPKGHNRQQRAYLSLGEVDKIADIWLNGHHVGISWTRGDRFDVTDILRPGKNLLTIEVGNTWSNRIVGDHITGEHFTRTNLVSSVKPSGSMLSGDKEWLAWKNVPLIKSGLIGPVIISLETVVAPAGAD